MKSPREQLKFTWLFVVLSLLKLKLVPIAYAVCPICTVTVGAALGISRMLGVDDTVTGIWVGGLILSASLWTVDWLQKQYKSKFKFKKFIDDIVTKLHGLSVQRFISFTTIFLFYLFTFIPLYYTKYIGLPFNKLWGVDKIVLSAGVGSIAFLIGVWADRRQREIYGRQFFNYQKVVFPITALIITSAIFYLITSRR